MLIEQAIFSRTAGGHSVHYELTAKSRGIQASDATALCAWGPAHDCLLDQRLGASSINFFPLPSGSFCISRSQSPVGGMWQDKGEVLTHALIVDADTLAQVGNDPFVVVDLMNVAGRWRHDLPRGDQLDSIDLPVERPIDIRQRITQAVSTFSLEWLVGTVDVLLNHSAVAIVGDSSRERLVSAVMACLPPACRGELSFSTGLKYSPRRPFRLFAVGGEPAEQQRVSRQGDVVMLDLQNDPPLPEHSAAGWSGWLREVLTGGELTAMMRRLNEMPRGVRLARLNTWGDLLLERRADANSDMRYDHEASTHAKRLTRHDGPKLKPSSGGISLVEETASDPAVVLGRDCPGAVEMLESLDDTLFEAICGRPGAMEELRPLWSDALRRVGPDLVEEARAQYVRHVMSLWRHCVDGDEVRNPALSVTVTEVMELVLAGR